MRNNEIFMLAAGNGEPEIPVCQLVAAPPEPEAPSHRAPELAAQCGAAAPGSPATPACRSALALTGQGSEGLAAPLPLDEAARIKAAEYWLSLGKADEALSELLALSGASWGHPWAIRTRIAALKFAHSLGRVR